MKKKSEPATACHTKSPVMPLSKQTNPKDKYKLILSIEELKSPVLGVVQSIFTRPEQKENIIKNTKPKNTTKSLAELRHHHNSTFTQTHKALGNSTDLQQLKKAKGKAGFTEKVHKLFATRKYNYSVNDDEDNIDRLNAKLDKYISRYLGPQRLSNLKQAL